MKILNKFKNPSFKVSKTDSILIELILENPIFFCTNPIANIAKKYKVSEASITRFARKMGFSNLQFFKLALNEDFSKSKNISIINKNITANESIMDTATKLLLENISTLEMTVQNLDEEEIALVCKKILSANRIYIIGLGNSGFVAEDSAYKFMRIGIDAISLNSSHNIMLHMALVNNDDLIIAISHSGETLEINKGVKLAKKSGADVICITSKKDSPLAKESTGKLIYKSTESFLETGSITTKLTQIFLIDLLYTQIVKTDMEKSKEIKSKTAKAIDFLYFDNKKDTRK